MRTECCGWACNSPWYGNKQRLPARKTMPILAEFGTSSKWD